MIVTFQGKDYSNFEKNPKVRSEWGEDVVKYFFESRNLRSSKTAEIQKGLIKIEKVLKLLVDDLFRNRDFYSIDLVVVIETDEERIARKNDEDFVRNIINKRIPYNLGKFNEKKGYGLFIDYQTDKNGQITRQEIYLIPKILFIEVKTFLKGSKPPIISETELYKYIYFQEEMKVAILLAIIEIDIINKKALINFIYPEKWKGIQKKWLKIYTHARVTTTDLPKYSRKPFPWKVTKGEKMYVPVLFLDKKGEEIKVFGNIITYVLEIETKSQDSID